MVGTLQRAGLLFRACGAMGAMTDSLTAQEITTGGDVFAARHRHRDRLVSGGKPQGRARPSRSPSGLRPGHFRLNSVPASPAFYFD